MQIPQFTQHLHKDYFQEKIAFIFYLSECRVLRSSISSRGGFCVGATYEKALI